MNNFFLSFVFTMAFWVPCAVFARCTKQDAITAETSTAILKNWNEVHESYKKYSHCDDGAIAEGYSESVSQLLANKWDQLDKLERIIKKDKKFGEFVVRHIDQTIGEEARTKISDNVLNRCPAKSKGLCNEISSGLKTK